MYVNPFGLGIFVGVVGTVAFCIAGIVAFAIWQSKNK